MMLESLLFILLLLISGLFIITALITMLVGFIKKSSALKKTALKITIIPIFCLGLIAFWYIAAVPSFNKSKMEDFAGTYTLNKSFKVNEAKLILSADGTYQLEGIEGIGLKKQGKWKTGGNEGMFEFYDNNGNLSQWATPDNNTENYKLSFEYQKGQNTEEIEFVKSKSE